MALTPLPLISGPGLYLTSHKFPFSTRSMLRASAYSSSCGPRRHFTLHSSSASASASAYSSSASASASAYSSSDADDDDDLSAHVPAAAPGAVAAPMKRTIAAAPATIAPHLCAAACALLGGGGDRAALAADAGRALAVARAALHSRVAGAGGSGELLAGDALLPLAFEILARGSGRAHGAALCAVVEVAAAIGASGAAGGYCVEAEGRGEEDAERVVEMTDGRMGECAAACGALAALAEEEEEEGVVGRVRRFGYYAGMMDGMLRRGAAAAAKEYKERAVAEVAGGGFDPAAATAAAEMVEGWYEARVDGGRRC